MPIKATPEQAIAAYRRVLRLVERYSRTENLDALRTDGRGFMTWREIRQHIDAALKIRTRPPRRPFPRPWK